MYRQYFCAANGLNRPTHELRILDLALLLNVIKCIAMYYNL